MIKKQSDIVAMHADAVNNMATLTADHMVRICKAAIAYSFRQVASSDVDVLDTSRELNLKLLAQVYSYLQMLHTGEHEWRISDEEIAEAINNE